MEALAPRYIAKVPVDIFSQSPLHYRRTERGYVVYSVGANRKDDGGKPREPGRYMENDLVIQVPAAN